MNDMRTEFLGLMYEIIVTPKDNTLMLTAFLLVRMVLLLIVFFFPYNECGHHYNAEQSSN